MQKTFADDVTEEANVFALRYNMKMILQGMVLTIPPF